MQQPAQQMAQPQKAAQQTDLPQKVALPENQAQQPVQQTDLPQKAAQQTDPQLVQHYAGELGKLFKVIGHIS